MDGLTPEPSGTPRAASVLADVGCILLLLLPMAAVVVALGKGLVDRTRASGPPARAATATAGARPGVEPAPVPVDELLAPPAADPAPSVAPPPPLPEDLLVFDDSPLPPAHQPPLRDLALLQDELAGEYNGKIYSSDWIQWQDRPGIPREPQRFPVEERVQRLLAEIARHGAPPAGAAVHVIPRSPDGRVRVDGILAPEEWDGALRLGIGRGDHRTVLLLQADARRLLIACRAHDDTTREGYDQLRFYFHVDQSPVVRNERIHVDSGGNVLRQTTLRWTGPEGRPVEVDPASNGRWRLWDITDWNVHRHARGRKGFQDGHVVYEASLSLVESGIPLDAPFPAFVEVETDPVLEGGRFKERVHAGELGSQEAPEWFRIEPR